MSLLPSAYSHSANSVWGRKRAFDICSSLVSHPALAGEAPPSPSVVVPGLSISLHISDMLAPAPGHRVTVTSVPALCRYQHCWHPACVYGAQRDASIKAGVATWWKQR